MAEPEIEVAEAPADVPAARASASSPAAQRLAAEQYAKRMANARRAMQDDTDQGDEVAPSAPDLSDSNGAAAGATGTDTSYRPSRPTHYEAPKPRWTAEAEVAASAPAAPASSTPVAAPAAPAVPAEPWEQLTVQPSQPGQPPTQYGQPAYGPIPPGYGQPGSSRSSRNVLIAVLIGALALAGGGAGVFLATRNGHPSKADFIKSADAICSPGNTSAAGVTKASSYPDLAAASRTVAAAANTQAAKLGGLDKPTGADAVQVRTMITELGYAGQAAQRVSAAASGSDDATAAAATREMGSAYNLASNAASAYGFTACATGLKGGMDAVFAGAHTVVKANFVAKADTACRAGADDLSNIPDARSESGAELARVLDQVAVVDDRIMSQVRALPVAPGDEGAVADIITAASQTAAKGKELADAARVENGPAFVAALHDLDTLGTAVDAKWDAYGLGSCGTHFGEG